MPTAQVVRTQLDSNPHIFHNEVTSGSRPGGLGVGLVDHAYQLTEEAGLNPGLAALPSESHQRARRPAFLQESLIWTHTS